MFDNQTCHQLQKRFLSEVKYLKFKTGYSFKAALAGVI
jgi:hypothetical protein